MFSKTSNFFKNIMLLLMPKRCPFCNGVIEENELICKRCEKDIPAFSIFQGITGGYRCASSFLYEGKFKYAVWRFKFYQKPQYSKPLAVFLHRSVQQSFPDMIFDYITYVPMHKKSLRKRGFNQSELLARDLSEMLSVPCVPTLEKIKYTSPQHDLKGKLRRTNLKGAFKVVDKQAIKGRSILLVDDIVTTGSTLGECAKTLQKCKPLHICCATVLTSSYHFYLEK